MFSDVIIRTRDLVKEYGDVTAVDHLNLEIRKGEIFGLLGPNGEGKTTTTLMLLGLTDPTSGTAEIDGLDCTRDSLAVKKIVGYLPDNVGFYPDMTGRENLIFSGMMNGSSRKEAKERAAKLLERVNMTYAADRKTGTYSRGMRQRLGIADVLMKDPEIIIMDEPTLGIDPSGMRELTKLIRELSVKDGRTILISSHELYQIQEISDRVGIFVEGKMIACGGISELGQQLQNEGLFIIDLKLDNINSFDKNKVQANKEVYSKNIEIGVARDNNLSHTPNINQPKTHDATDIDTHDTDSDIEREKALIREISGIRLMGVKADGTIHIESSRDIRQDLLPKLAEAGFILSELHESGGDLEEIYRKYFERETA